MESKRPCRDFTSSLAKDEHVDGMRSRSWPTFPELFNNICEHRKPKHHWWNNVQYCAMRVNKRKSSINQQERIQRNKRLANMTIKAIWKHRERQQVASSHYPLRTTQSPKVKIELRVKAAETILEPVDLQDLSAFSKRRNHDWSSGAERRWLQVLERFGGRRATEEWRRLMALAQPLGEISKAQRKKQLGFGANGLALGSGTCF